MGGPKWYYGVPGYTDNRHVPVGGKVTINGVTFAAFGVPQNGSL